MITTTSMNGTKRGVRPMTRWRLACVVGIGAVALSLKPAAMAQSETPKEPVPAGVGAGAPATPPKPELVPGGPAPGPAQSSSVAAVNESVVAEMQQAKAEVEKLRAELVEADARLKQLEARHAGLSRVDTGSGIVGKYGAVAVTVAPAPETDQPGAKGVAVGQIPKGNYRVIQPDGKIVEYTMDGKLVTVWNTGVRPGTTPGLDPAASGFSRPMSMTPPAAPAPGGGAPANALDVVKKLDRLEAQVHEMSVEISRLKSELGQSNRPGPSIEGKP